MLEERYIEVLAYNLETVLAEKLETVIARNITNTRMRDFYDIYVLLQLYGDTLNSKVLKEALIATTTKRATEYHLDDLAMIFDEVEDDFTIQKLWKLYQNKFSYAEEVTWKMVMNSVRHLYQLTLS